jgi:8-oxo-dGTP pyrophosphatase MutT (NUDIX family)
MCIDTVQSREVPELCPPILDETVGLVARPVAPHAEWKKRRASRAVFLNTARTHVGLIYWPQCGGYYLLPGGKIEQGETPDEAVLREVHQETGYTGEILGRLGKVLELRTQSPLKQWSHGYVVVENGGDGVQSLTEKEERMGILFRWVRIADVPALLKQWPVRERESADDRLLFSWYRDSCIFRAAGERGYLTPRA